MSEQMNECQTWEDVILNFFEQKVQNIKQGQKCELFSVREYIEKKEKEIGEIDDEKKRSRAIIAKEKKQKEYEQIRQDAPSTEIREWIDKASEINIDIGKRIIKASHVLKFTHGSAEPAGLLLETKSNDLLLTTASLKQEFEADLAHNNGNLITVSRFLAQKFKGKQIIDLILNNDFCFFKPFAGDESQLKKWEIGFSSLVEKRDLRTADKAKQIYFPIKNLDLEQKVKYHIVIPIFSSSLTNNIDSIITTLKYGDKQKEVNKYKKEQYSKYRKSKSIEYPNLCIQNFGGDHPKNISMLNADRGGKAYLFSTQPPIWQSQLKPPVNKRSIFQANTYSSDYLRDFLLRFQRIDLSIRDPEKKKWIDRWVIQIIDEIMIYAISIQNLPAGWSRGVDVKLKSAYQYFLDPYRQDEQFQKTRQEVNWQNVICKDFAIWLNGILKGKKKLFTPQPEHTRMWMKLMEKELMEHSQDIEWDIKEQKRNEKV
jgi:CRISPR-associated protein Csy1